ncbi:MAG TPA: hypothetical protein VF881_17075 [Polyangiaceae bacterium]
MRARRVVGTMAPSAAMVMATGGCLATEGPNLAALAERSERIEFPYRAARSDRSLPRGTLIVPGCE